MHTTLLIASLLASPAAAQTWPDDASWQPLMRGDEPLGDGDDAAAATLDLVGDGIDPLASWAADDLYLYLRLRLELSSVTGDAYGVLWDVDGDGAIDALTAAVGPEEDLGIYAPGGQRLRLAISGPYTLGVSLRGATRHSGAFFDLALKRRELETELGVAPSDAVRWLPVTLAVAVAGDTLDGGFADIAGCPDLLCETWNDIAPDPVAIDADDDGLTGTVEAVLGTDPTLADSDGGGLDDGFEDRDHDGVIGPFETDPLAPGDDADADADTLPDVVERDAGGLPVDSDRDGTDDEDDPDSDNDLLDDRLDGVLDVDGDGLPAFRDPDADNDGLGDGQEGTSDPDCDGLPAHLDVDSDGDGIGDFEDGLADFDGDGDPNFLDLDSDGDGIPDAEEGTADRDCDGRADFLDVIGDDGFCDTDLPIGEIDDGPFDRSDDPLVRPTDEDFPNLGCTCRTGTAPLGVWWMLPLVWVGRRRR